MPDNFIIFFIERLAAVDHKDDQIRTIERFLALFDTDFFDDILGLSDASRIRQTNRNPAN